MTLKRSYERGEINRMLANAGPATLDDVSITSDGRRLDSAEAVIAFFDEIRASREVLPEPIALRDDLRHTGG